MVKGKTLDFGCGSKPYEKTLNFTSSYIGVDIAESGHDHKDSKVDVFYDGQDIPFPNEYFDSIVCFEVFEHLTNPDRIMEEFHRVLMPGGVLMLTVPFLYPEHEMPTDFQRWTSVGLHQILCSQNFVVLTIEKTNTGIGAILQNFYDFIFGNLSFRYKRLNLLLQLPMVIVFNILGLCAVKILPKSTKYYSNLCVIAKKPLT